MNRQSRRWGPPSLSSLFAPSLLILSVDEDWQQGLTFVNENVETAAEYVEEFEIFAAAVAKKAIPQCNIVFMSDAQMKDALQAYLTVLHTQNPASIGGALPGEEFYR